MIGGFMAVERLIDGRLQLWVVGPNTGTLYTSQETAAGTWAPFSPFVPSPSPFTGNLLSAHSPNGRVQLWLADDVNLVARTTWQLAPTAGWTKWEPFPLPVGARLLGAGELEDGRMQLFAAVPAADPNQLFINWKISTETDAPWNGWKLFNPQPSANLVMPGGGLRTGNLTNGYLGVWSLPGPVMYWDLETAWQTSANPGAAWSNWDTFRYPVKDPNFEGLNIAVHVCAGSTQLWLIDGLTLQSLRLKSTFPSSGYTAFENPFLPDPGPVVDLTVGEANGICHIFVMAQGPAHGPAQILTSQQTSASATTFTAWESLGSLS
jgi:hypothetical protein